MVAILVRALTTVMTVVIAVLVSATLGDSASGKIWASAFIASFIALTEWLIIWAPRRFAYARRLLDPRSAHVGVWLQRMRRVVPTSPSRENENKFAVFWVDYRSDGYHVGGFAFDRHGNELARWRSEGSPDFGPDGQSMTYFWKGEVVGLEESVEDINRTGVTNISLANKSGRVDHVGLNRILLFDIEPVSTSLLLKLGLAKVTPEQLKDPTRRDDFARAFARERRDFSYGNEA